MQEGPSTAEKAQDKAKDAAGTVKEKTQQVAGKTAEALKSVAGMFSLTLAMPRKLS